MNWVLLVCSSPEDDAILERVLPTGHIRVGVAADHVASHETSFSYGDQADLPSVAAGSAQGHW